MKTSYYLLFFVIIFCSTSSAQYWEKIDSIFAPSGVTVKSFSAPAFCDLDKDGDLDLLLGNNTDYTEYFENTGPSGALKFTKKSSILASIYVTGMMGTNHDYPAAADLDNDGDLDLVIGGYNGLIYYRNTGTSAAPVWERDSVVFISIKNDVGQDPKPAFADLDGDGDLDLIVGIGESLFGGPTPGITMAYRNNGNETSPKFESDNSLITGIPDIGLNSYPTFADLDGDRDYDLLFGRDLQTFVYYENTGTSNAPVWTNKSSLFSGVETTTYWKNPTLADIDKDGDFDLIYGSDGGRIFYYQNTGTAAAPKFTYNPNYFNVEKADGYAGVSFADYDKDGDYDMISGDWLGKFYYFKNIGDSFKPRFKSTASGFTSLNPGPYAYPVFVDIDNDNDQDIVSGVLNGKLFCYINTNDKFTLNSTIFSMVNTGGFSVPAFADLDNDGDQDLLVGAERSDSIHFYLNKGNNIFAIADSFFAGVSFLNKIAPTFTDIDNDGDFDLFFGRSFGESKCFINTGNKNYPQWNENDSIVAGIKVRQNAHPGFADLDRDGRKDMVIGEYDGNFNYFKNLFSDPTSAPKSRRISGREFRLDQNYPNPFNPVTVIGYHVAIPSNVTIKVYDILGNEVTTLVNEFKEAGNHNVRFNAASLGLAGGVYLYNITAGSYSATKKLVLIK